MSEFVSTNEEQEEEIAVLSSIYPQEFLRLGDTLFQIQLVPNPHNTDENHVGATITISLPPDYPSVVIPNFTVTVSKGLTSSSIAEITSICEKIAEENIGSPSVYSVCEAVREWLSDNNIPGQDGSMYSEMMRRMGQVEIEDRKQKQRLQHKEMADSELKDKDHIDPAELERLQKRQAGTVVTVESFMRWKESFESELRQQREALVTTANKNEWEEIMARPTGKQLFLAGIVKVGDEEKIVTLGENEVVAEGGDDQEDDDDDDDEDYVDNEEEDDDNEEEG